MPRRSLGAIHRSDLDVIRSKHGIDTVCRHTVDTILRKHLVFQALDQAIQPYAATIVRQSLGVIVVGCFCHATKDFQFIANIVVVFVIGTRAIAIQKLLWINTRTVLIRSRLVVVAGHLIRTTWRFQVVANSIAIRITEADSFAVISCFWQVPVAIASSCSDATTTTDTALIKTRARTVIVRC